MKCIVIPKPGPATPIGAGVRVGLADGAVTGALGGCVAAARWGAGALEGAPAAAVGGAMAAVVAVCDRPAVGAPQALRRTGASSSTTNASATTRGIDLACARRASGSIALLPRRLAMRRFQLLPS